MCVCVCTRTRINRKRRAAYTVFLKINLFLNVFEGPCVTSYIQQTRDNVYGFQISFTSFIFLKRGEGELIVYFYTVTTDSWIFQYVYYSCRLN